MSDEDFEIIYKTYYSRLYYYTFQFITDEENSKDIVNDVFEKIWIQRHNKYLQLIIPQYFISNKSGIWSLSLIVHSKG